MIDLWPLGGEVAVSFQCPRKQVRRLVTWLKEEQRAEVRYPVLMSVFSNILLDLQSLLLLLKPMSDLSSEESGAAAQHSLL